MIIAFDGDCGLRQHGSMRNAQLQRMFDAAGGVSALARALGLDHSTVSGWRELPAKHVGAVARLTGLSLHALRPDLFPQDEPRGFAETQAPFADEARALGLDPDAIARAALAEAVRVEKERRWREENRASYESQNAWIAKHGLPLAKYRTF